MKVFFYNPSTKTSIWERPHELKNRADVDKMLKAPGTADDKVAEVSGNHSDHKSPDDQKRELETSDDSKPPIKKAK